MKNILTQILLALSFFSTLNGFSQNGSITGRVFNEKNNEPLPFVNIIIQGTTIGSTTDLDGKFIFKGLNPGYIKLATSTIGFERKITEEFMVTNSKSVNVEIGLKESIINLDVVEVRAALFEKKSESPVSVKTLGISELERSPGGNRDVSKVIQSLPGVSSGVSFRNDVVVRGGGPNENRFYLDDIEIPNLNHFATQGASGGPVGIINIDFVRGIEFYSGAFPASKGNALSSVLMMKQIEGNKEKLQFKGAFGASDLSLAIDGPLGKKTTYLFSVRRSYLQFLFGVIGLPFLPTYNDYQFKITHKFNLKNQISIISLGALDQFKLNTGIKNPTDFQRYVLGYLPVNEQWNYTLGVVYKHFTKNGFQNYIFSRNYLNNTQLKYLNNDESIAANKTLDYSSHEIENKFRFEDNLTINNFKITAGFGSEYAKYYNRTYNRIILGTQELNINYASDLEMVKWNLFAQVSKPFFNDKLTLSAGLRSDANNYSASMSNLLNQISPRISASYNFSPKWNLNLNIARYYQQPTYTTLGYRDSLGILLNKQQNLTYIGVDHFVAGVEYYPTEKMKISVEGFYKNYHNYPFSIQDSVPLASKGADFGVIGDEAVTSTSKGRAYGIELYATQKMSKTIDFTLSYTFVRSEFEKTAKKYIPSAWDNQHLLNIILSKSFKHNWNAGLKWRFIGGSPYTPVDYENSSRKIAWDIRGRTVIDYAKFNSLRLKSFHQLDIRVDKAFYFKKLSMTLYLDIQNVYNFQSDSAPLYVQSLNAAGNAIIQNPSDPVWMQKYQLKKLEGSGGGTVLPTIGIIVEL
ncbi:MAG: TonB-dependent receptor [Bacteroidota bacterium]